MKTEKMLTVTLCLLAASWLVPARAADAPENGDNSAKEMSGMSILGNSEAPKSLVIVPWKTSEIGDGIGVANMLDGRARPVDKDVFIRELDYYELRTHSAPRVISKETTSVAGAKPGQ